MKKITEIISFIVYMLFLAVSFGLPFMSFEGYSMLSNTTSHLAAQGSPYAWVMNAVFVCLGVMAILISCRTQVSYHQVMGSIFGVCLMMTALFPHAPLVETVSPNVRSDEIHSLFASLTGFSFTLLAAGHGAVSRGKQRYGGFVMAVLAMVIPAGMMIFPPFMGILQRMMFMSAFGWLFFFIKPPNNLRKQ